MNLETYTKHNAQLAGVVKLHKCKNDANFMKGCLLSFTIFNLILKYAIMQHKKTRYNSKKFSKFFSLSFPQYQNRLAPTAEPFVSGGTLDLSIFIKILNRIF